MSTITNLNFSVESSWDGSGIDEAMRSIATLKAEIEGMTDGRIQLEVELQNQREVQEQVDEVARNRDMTINADADTAEAKAKIDEAAQNRDTEIKVKTDTAEAKAAIDLAARNRDTEIKVKMDRSQINEAEQAFMGLGRSAEQAFNPAHLSSFGDGIGTVATKVGGLLSNFQVLQWVVIGFAGISLTPLIGQLVQAAGVIALMPAGIAAVVSVFATMKIGMSGVMDAFQAYQKMQDNAASDATQQQHAIESAQRAVQAATRGSEAAQRDYEAAIRSTNQANRELVQAQQEVGRAEQGVADAQRSTLRAQQSLNDARRQATQDLEDMNRQLARASLDEEGAALAVAEAQRELQRTNSDPRSDALDRAEAQHRLNVAIQDQQDTLQKNRELQEKVNDANQKGVEGSDKVVAAKDAVERAAEGEAQAQDRLANAHDRVAQAQQNVINSQDNIAQAQQHIVEAQQNVVDAQNRLTEATNRTSSSQADFAQKMGALSPAAAAFVTTMIGMKGAYDDLKNTVQDNLFDKLGDSFSSFANSWLPTVKGGLGEIATQINEGVRKALRDFDTDANHSTVAKIFDNIAKSIQPVIDGLKNLFEGFLNLAGVGSEFLPGLGDSFDNISKKFKDWTQNPDNQGKFRDWIKESIEAFKNVMNLIVQIGRIIGDVFGATKENGKGQLESLADNAKKLADYLATPEGQKKIRDFFEGLRDTLNNIFEVCRMVVSVLDKIDSLSHNNLIKTSFGNAEMTDKFLEAAGNPAQSGKNAAKGAGDWMADHPNSPITQGATWAADTPEHLHDLWRSTWNIMRTEANVAWEGMKIGWNATASFFRDHWNDLGGQLSRGWNTVWTNTKTSSEGIWRSLNTSWHGALDTLDRDWNTYSGILGGGWSAFWTNTRNEGQRLWGDIRAKWSDTLNGVQDTWNQKSPLLGAAWTSFWTTISSVARGIWDGVKKGFASFMEDLMKGFGEIVVRAEQVWGGIKRAFGAPINFVFNAVSDTVGKVIPALHFDHDPVKYADGGLTKEVGQIKALGGTRADTHPILVSGQEYVVNGEAASKPGMLQHLDAINYGGAPAPTSANNNFAPFGPGIAAFQDGGSVDKGPHGEPSSTEAIQRALNWAGGNSGREYNADGWLDCSGLASGVYDVLLGKSPHREFTTVSDFESLGFVRGMGGVFDIGVLPLPGDSGHMAMSLGGHNIESAGGGKGIQVDGSAWGASNPYFTDHYFLPGNLFSPQYFGTGWAGSSANDPGFWGKIGNVIGGVANFGRSTLAETVQRLTDPIINAIPAPIPGTGSPAGNVVHDLAAKVRDEAVSYIRGHDNPTGHGSGGGFSNTIPSPEHKAIIDQAIDLAGGVSDRVAWENGFETLISRESGWNAGAINNWDSNAAEGFPTKGLTQMRDDTFAAHAVPGHTDIWNPVDNIASDIGYIKSRYGDITNVQQANPNASAKGYQDGTKNADPGWAIVGEAGPEMIKFNGGEQVMSNQDTQNMLKNLQSVAQQHASSFQNALTAPIDAVGQDLGIGSITGGSGFIPQLINQSIKYAQELNGWTPPAGSLLAMAGVGTIGVPGMNKMQQSIDPSMQRDLSAPRSAPQAQAEAGVQAQAQALKEGVLPNPADRPFIGGDVHLTSGAKDPVADFYRRLDLHHKGFDPTL